MNHSLKIGYYISIFMRSRNIKNSSWGIVGVMIFVLIHITDPTSSKGSRHGSTERD